MSASEKCIILADNYWAKTNNEFILINAKSEVLTMCGAHFATLLGLLVVSKHLEMTVL